jgi:toxin ParE1/3/4
VIVVYRPAALADLEAIYDTTVNLWGMHQAEHYVSLIRATVERICVHPRSGRQYADIGKFRSIPSGRHLIFYTWRDDTITIIRVLHDRMDLRPKLGDGRNGHDE